MRELGFADRFDEVKRLIAGKVKGQPEPRELLDIKAAIRRAEAKAADRSFGLDPSHVHFLNLPFYETGGLKKAPLSQRDIDIIVKLLREIEPDQIYAAGDLADPHGTHRTCMGGRAGSVGRSLRTTHGSRIATCGSIAGPGWSGIWGWSTWPCPFRPTS